MNLFGKGDIKTNTEELAHLQNENQELRAEVELLKKEIDQIRKGKVEMSKEKEETVIVATVQNEAGAKKEENEKGAAREHEDELQQEEIKPEEEQAPTLPDLQATEETPDVTSHILQEMLERLELLEKMYQNELSMEHRERQEIGKKLAERQSKYEDLLQRAQEDSYRKDKLKLINKMIFFADLIRRMLYEFNSNRNEEEPKSEETVFLEQQLERITEAMDDTLRHEMVSVLPMAKEGDEFVEEKMEVIDTERTTDPAKAGKIFRSISACYTWTLPYVLKARVDEKGEEVRHYRFILHPEEVIIYKLQK